MKTMTDQDLGSLRRIELHETTADEVIKAQTKYPGEAVAGSGQASAYALVVMKRRRRHPISGTGWQGASKFGFAAGPEDRAHVTSDAEPGCR